MNGMSPVLCVHDFFWGWIVKSKMLVVAVFCAAALVLVLALVLDFSGSQAPNNASKQSEPSTPVAIADTAKPTASAEASKGSKEASAKPKERKTKAAAGEAPAKSADPKAKATRPSWDPEPSGSESRLEVPEKPEATKFSLPDTPDREPVLEHAPKTGVAKGKLTKDFPAAAVPLPKSTTIVTSSVEQQAKLVFVGVEARSEDSVDEVLAFYAKHFADLNWLTTENGAGKGMTQLSGSFGSDSTTVTVRQLPTGATSIVAAGVFEVQE